VTAQHCVGHARRRQYVLRWEVSASEQPRDPCGGAGGGLPTIGGRSTAVLQLGRWRASDLSR